MKVERVFLTKMKLDPNNERIHNERNIKAIKKSLEEFGQQSPIVLSQDGTILKGNGTYLAAKELEWKELVAVYTDLKDKNQQRAYRIADNRTGELAEWDLPRLSETLRSLNAEHVNLSATGFEEFEIEPLLAAEWTPPPIDDEEFTVDPSGTKLAFTSEQWSIIDSGIELIKQRNKRNKVQISDADAVTMIIEEWLG